MIRNKVRCWLSSLLYLFLFLIVAGSLLLHELFCSCASGGYSLAVVHKLLTAVSLLLLSIGSRALRLQQLKLVGSGVVAPRLQGLRSVDVAHGFCSSLVCGIFPDQGQNLCLLHWQAASLPLSHEGSLVLVYHFYSVLYWRIQSGK